MSGLSEALVATAVGLLVAPCVVAYNYFSKNVKELLGGTISRPVFSWRNARGQGEKIDGEPSCSGDGDHDASRLAFVINAAWVELMHLFSLALAHVRHGYGRAIRFRRMSGLWTFFEK